jgi:2-dehydropantoate 2-reductase
MGCLFGSLLSRSGEDVVLVDKVREVVAALRERGVRLHEEGGVADVPVRAVDDVGLAGSAELVLVMVKAQHTPSAAAGLRPLLGPKTVVLTLQNGLGAAQVLAERLDSRRLLVGVTAQGATLLGPGEVRHGGSGESLLGPYCRAGADPGSVAQVLTRAGLPARAVEDPWPAVWRKLAVNCGINPVAALTGLLNGQISGILDAEAVLADAVREAATVARVAGVDLGDPGDLVRTVLEVARATGKNRASMGQDVDARRPTEIDFINGAVVREGERLGVPTPVNRTLTRLIKTLESTFRPAGSGTFSQ